MSVRVRPPAPRSPTAADKAPASSTPTWFVYVLRCGDGTLYTGITTDVQRRLAQHAGLRQGGARYLRGRGPLRLVLLRSVGERRCALSLERQIKRLSRMRKELLIAATRPRARA